jgi:glutathione S-transferase
MKLYYAPGACSLAAHIAFEEIGIPVELERVDLETGQTALGEKFASINPKGYVPALVLHDGTLVTENIAVLDWIADEYPVLGLAGPLGRTRLIETLAYLSTEVHKSFKPLFAGKYDEEMARARVLVARRLELLAERTQGPYLFGVHVSVADCYLFVMLLWSKRFGIAIPPALLVLLGSMVARPAVQRAMGQEGLRVPLAEGSLQKRAEVA